MAEDGVITSGYGTEYAWQVRAVGYSLVGDEVIPSNEDGSRERGNQTFAPDNCPPLPWTFMPSPPSSL